MWTEESIGTRISAARMDEATARLDRILDGEGEAQGLA